MGCTTSTPIQHSVVQAKKQSDTVTAIDGNTTKSTSRFRRLEKGNFETYQLVWLDKDVNSTTDSLETQKKLKEVINRLRTFDSSDQCELYIKGVQRDQKIILIVSSSYGRQIIPRISKIRQLSVVYIYCTKEETNSEYVSLDGKVKNIFTNPDELIRQLKQDQHIRERTDDDSVAISIYSRETGGVTSVQEQRDSRNASFMYFLLFIDILLKMPPNDAKAKSELIEVWSDTCQGNESEQLLIKEFEETYEPSKAIWWYTRESFLYRILNRGLREADLDILFGLRFYIIDLAKILIRHHEIFLLQYSLSKQPIFRVYRGQVISIDELNLIRESRGEFISFNNFLSTSTNETMARSYAKDTAISDGLTRVLFEFNIDSRLKDSKPYADISKKSYYQHENEVLLMLGSIFRIEDVQYDEQEQMWSAKLSLCGENDYELKDLMTKLKYEVQTGDVAALGWLLYRQGEHKKSKQFFEGLLSDETTADFDRASCYRGLGSVATEVGEYDEALANHQSELALWLKLDEQEHVARSYMSIGEVYCYKTELDLALSYEQKALDIFLPLNHRKLADIYGTIAKIHLGKNEFQVALEYYEKSFEVDCQHMPKNHINFGVTYKDMGRMYGKMGDYKKALEYFYKAREIYLKSLPLHHPHISGLQDDIDNAKDNLHDDK